MRQRLPETISPDPLERPKVNKLSPLNNLSEEASGSGVGVIIENTDSDERGKFQRLVKGISKSSISSRAQTGTNLKPGVKSGTNSDSQNLQVQERNLSLHRVSATTVVNSTYQPNACCPEFFKSSENPNTIYWGYPDSGVTADDPYDDSAQKWVRSMIFTLGFAKKRELRESERPGYGKKLSKELSLNLNGQTAATAQIVTLFEGEKILRLNCSTKIVSSTSDSDEGSKEELNSENSKKQMVLSLQEDSDSENSLLRINFGDQIGKGGIGAIFSGELTAKGKTILDQSQDQADESEISVVCKVVPLSSFEFDMAREYSHQMHTQLRYMDLSRSRQDELRAAGLLRVYGLVLVDREAVLRDGKGGTTVTTGMSDMDKDLAQAPSVTVGSEGQVEMSIDVAQMNQDVKSLSKTSPETVTGHNVYNDEKEIEPNESEMQLRSDDSDDSDDSESESENSVRSFDFGNESMYPEMNQALRKQPEFGPAAAKFSLNQDQILQKASENGPGATVGYLVTVMERAPPGYVPLREVMKSGLTFLDAKVLLQRIMACVQKLHSFGILHLDVKPDNFLCKVINSNKFNTSSSATVSAESQLDFHVLLVDYDGFCTISQFQRYQSTRKVPSTDIYTAPERFHCRPNLNTPAEQRLALSLSSSPGSVLKHPPTRPSVPNLSLAFLPDCPPEVLLQIDVWSLGIIALELFFDWEFLQEIGTQGFGGGGGHLGEITRGSAGPLWAHDEPFGEEWRRGRLDQLRFGRERYAARRLDVESLRSGDNHASKGGSESEVIYSLRGNPVLANPQRYMELIVKTGVSRLKHRILEQMASVENTHSGCSGDYKSESESPSINCSSVSLCRSDGKWTRYTNFNKNENQDPGALLKSESTTWNSQEVRVSSELVTVVENMLEGLDSMLIGMLQVNPRFRTLPVNTNNNSGTALNTVTNGCSGWKFLFRDTDPSFRVGWTRDQEAFKVQGERLVELEECQRKIGEEYENSKSSDSGCAESAKAFFNSHADAFLEKYNALTARQFRCMKIAIQRQRLARLEAAHLEIEGQGQADDPNTLPLQSTGSTTKLLKALCYITLTSGDPASGRGFGGFLRTYSLPKFGDDKFKNDVIVQAPILSTTAIEELSLSSSNCSTSRLSTLQSGTITVTEPQKTISIPRNKFPNLNRLSLPQETDMGSMVLKHVSPVRKTGPQLGVLDGPPCVARFSRIPKAGISLSDSIVNPNDESNSPLTVSNTETFFPDLANPFLITHLCQRGPRPSIQRHRFAQSLREKSDSDDPDSNGGSGQYNYPLLDPDFVPENIGTSTVHGLSRRQRANYWDALEKYWTQSSSRQGGLSDATRVERGESLLKGTDIVDYVRVKSKVGQGPQLFQEMDREAEIRSRVLDNLKLNGTIQNQEGKLGRVTIGNRGGAMEIDRI